MNDPTNPAPASESDPYAVMVNGLLCDPYLIGRAFKVTDPAIFQALKKILRSGKKHKDLHTDIREAIESLQRWEDMELAEAGITTEKPERQTAEAEDLLAAWIQHTGSESAMYPCENFKAGYRAARKASGPPTWIDPPECPKCDKSLKPAKGEAATRADWVCPNHAGSKSMWYDYELTSILRDRLRNAAATA